MEHRSKHVRIVSPYSILFFQTYRVDLRKTFGDHSNEVVAALTLNNLQGPLYLYAISVGVVVLVFLFELALAKFKYRPSTQ